MRLVVVLSVSAAVAVAVGALSRGQDPAPCPCPPAPTNLVLRWNEEALRAVRADRTPPPVAARNLAVLHVAVYDAVAAATGAFRPFKVPAGSAGGNPDAAAATAAHRVLVDLYPRHVEELDAALDDTLGPVPDGSAKVAGVALGQRAAEQVLHWRGPALLTGRGGKHPPGMDPGRWRPTPDGYAAPLLPGWAAVRCFALPGLDRFRPPGPPALDSREYAAALQEVAAVGGKDSPTRTRDQTEVARFWADGEGTITPPGHWNRIAQSVAADRRLGTADAARLFGLLNVALADAAVVCWDCKYRNDFWRPVTAARITDPGWTPLLPTPPFPAYTSGHSSFSGAAAGALAAFFGTDEVRFTTTSDGVPGVSRAFTSFSAAAEEAGVSRIYGGIHWAFDNRAGLTCGREVGEYVARHHFRPAGEAPGVALPAAPTVRRVVPR